MSSTPLYGFSDTSFQTAGGIDGIRKLVDDFYSYMDKLPEAAHIRAMHKADLTESRDKLTLFLCGWMGGPKLYGAKYGSINIPRDHMHLPIAASERDAWLLCMNKALAQQTYPEDFKLYLLQQLRIPAERITQVCQQTDKSLK